MLAFLRIIFYFIYEKYKGCQNYIFGIEIKNSNLKNLFLMPIICLLEIVL